MDNSFELVSPKKSKRELKDLLSDAEEYKIWNQACKDFFGLFSITIIAMQAGGTICWFLLPRFYNKWGGGYCGYHPI